MFSTFSCSDVWKCYLGSWITCFSFFSRKSLKALTEDKENKIPIKIYMCIYISTSCWFYGTWRNMAYLFPIESINSIVSLGSLRGNKGQQSGQRRSLPHVYWETNPMRKSSVRRNYSTLYPGNPLSPCKRLNISLTCHRRRGFLDCWSRKELPP